MSNSINKRRGHDLTEETFGSLLNWLDSDRERAAIRYETIRSRLIKIFTARGCSEPEDLADMTINRVAHGKLELSVDPEQYFLSVAKRVHLEFLRTRTRVQSIPESEVQEDIDSELRFVCLDRCIGSLPEENRKLILQYYLEEKSAKIDARRRLASQLGIPLNALRIRAHRIRILLGACVEKCMKDPGSEGS